MKTIRHLSFDDARKLIEKWMDEDVGNCTKPSDMIRAFLEYLYEHDFEIVNESTIWDTIFPRRKYD